MAQILNMLAQEEDNVRKFFKEDVLDSINEFLNWGLHLGEEGENSIHITIGLILLLIIAFIATDFVLKTIRRLYTNKMEGDDKLKFISIFKFIKYFVYLLVILLTLRAGGIDITLLITASAALFVGLGLALQDLFQDIIGGIFIITDKSVQVGDIVETEGKVGKIVEIKLRTTRAITRDDRVIIIPNHKFMKDIVYNYTQNNETTRERNTLSIASQSEDVFYVSEEGIYIQEKSFIVLGSNDGLALVCRFLVTTEGVSLNSKWLVVNAENELNKTGTGVIYPPVKTNAID